MKIKSLVLSLVIGAGLTASSLFANSVVLYATGFNGGNAGGGEFQAVTSDDGSFLTFCVEKNVDFYYGAPYSYTFDGPNILSAGGKITAGTAWLYEAFMTGTLVDGSTNGGGNYSDNRYLNAGLLQNAIWMLQGQMTGTNYYTNLVGNNMADYTGTNVEVMNLWSSGIDGQRLDAQSQLRYVPDGGVTIALLGFGLLSLAFFRRKL